MIKKIRDFFKAANQARVVIKRDGWSNVLTGLGQSGRDKNQSTFFKSCPIFGFCELDQMYRSDGLTKRIIDIVAAEMIRQGWEIDGDPEGALLSQLEEMTVNKTLTQLIQWARLYGGAIVVMGIADGRPLDAPVDIENIQEIVWMRCFDRWMAIPDYATICRDLNSPNYGYPDFYQVNDWRTQASFLVHHSRVLRMDWSEPPPHEAYSYNSGWGDSVVVSIYEEQKNFGQAMANTATIMHDFVNGVMKIPDLAESMATSCAETDSQLKKRLDWANLGKSVTNMMVLDGAESFEKLSTNVAGLSELIDRFMLNLSGVTGIPITLLFGRAPAGLNATGDADIRNFYDMIKQCQESKLKPILEKLVFYFMKSKNGPFGGVEPENWSIQFNPLWQVTEDQEATMRRTVAETDRIYIEMGVLDANEVAISRFGGDRWSMNTLIDLKARENGYDPNEVEELEAEKEEEIKTMPPEPSIGPDYLGRGSGASNGIVVVNT